MPDDHEQILWTYRLKSLCASSPDIEGAAVIIANGKLIASVGFDYSRLDLVVAQLACLASLGHSITDALGQGQVEAVFAKTLFGYTILCPPDDDKILVVIAKAQAVLSINCIEFLTGGSAGAARVPN